MIKITYSQFQILRHLFNYTHQSGEFPTSRDLYQYILYDNIIYQYHSISARLSELRKLGLVQSYKVKGKRSKENQLTVDGYNTFLENYQQNEEFKKKMRMILNE